MPRETIEKYAPIVLLVIALILQWNLFVTPEKLEQKHREIIRDIADSYTTKSEFDIVRKQYDDVNKKLDKIYDILTARK